MTESNPTEMSDRLSHVFASRTLTDLGESVYRHLIQTMAEFGLQNQELLTKSIISETLLYLHKVEMD